MEGVTILNTVEFSNSNGISFFLILCAIGLIATIIFMIALFKDGDWAEGVLVAIISATFASCLLFVAFVMIYPPESEEYEVIISDEVSFSEFTAKYEIIEQRGKIYVVRERELS